ncbi:MAG: hypothetical protein JWN95_2913 [Frankiales bacterium]|nr:hypothetical protein [Frankiales bacterium]
MSFRFTKQQSLIAAAVVVVLAAGGTTAALLTGNDKKSAAAPLPSQTATTPATSKPPAPTPKPTKKPAPPPVNYLTGIGAASSKAVIAVKIDDTDNGRPPLNLNQADIVYIEQAEGGLTRLVAVFATNHPVVEPVRSTRASDPELLSQYGKITLVASGGGGDSIPVLQRSILKGVINDLGGPGFSRDDNRSSPYNLTSNLQQVAAAEKGAPAKNVGFHWSAGYAALAKSKSAPSISTRVGGTPVSFSYNPTTKKYQRTVDGVTLRAANGAAIATPNVIVQMCRVATDYTDVDVAGNPSQYTHSIGSGRVVLFRNGKRIEGKWSRPSLLAPTKFTDLTGKPLQMAPGGAYVVLATNGAPV